MICFLLMHARVPHSNAVTVCSSLCGALFCCLSLPPLGLRTTHRQHDNHSCNHGNGVPGKDAKQQLNHHCRQ